MAITLRAGEKGVEINLSVTEAGSAYDLTGATVELLIQGSGERTMTIVGNPEAGNVRYTTIEGDFPTAGTFQAQLRVEPSAGKRYFSDVTEITVESVVAIA